MQAMIQSDEFRDIFWSYLALTKMSKNGQKSRKSVVIPPVALVWDWLILFF